MCTVRFNASTFIWYKSTLRHHFLKEGDHKLFGLDYDTVIEETILCFLVMHEDEAYNFFFSFNLELWKSCCIESVAQTTLKTFKGHMENSFAFRFFS